jgi:hypothetical protein
VFDESSAGFHHRCCKLVSEQVATRVGTEGHLFALRLLPADLRQQEFLPTIGAMDIAGTQLGGQIVAFTVEQQQGMITGGLEVAVVSTLLLPTMDPDFGAVHVQHYPSR